MIKKLIIIFSFVFIVLNLSYDIVKAQMPDWTLLVDRDNNRYYIDKNGKIWTSGNPEFDFKPVSPEGIEYYINQGIELINNHNKYAGLQLLKSIKAMPADNNLIYKAQIKASSRINDLIKTEGTRFEKLNKDASILLYKTNESAMLINDFMKYSVKIPLNFKIVSKTVREKNEYFYYGIKIGIKFSRENPDVNKGFSSFDILLAIDSETFSYKIKNVKRIEDHWRMRQGYDTFKRDKIFNDDNNAIYTYEDSYPPYYSGFEGYYSSGRNGYYVKAITSRELFRKYKSGIMGISESFKAD